MTGEPPSPALAVERHDLGLLEGAYSLTRSNQKARNRLFAREAHKSQLATAI